MTLTKADTAESQFNEFGWHNREARSDVDQSVGWGLLGKRALTHYPQGEFSRGRVKAVCIDVAIRPSGRVWRRRQWPTAAPLNPEPPGNEAPVFTSSTTATVKENRTAAYMAVATDSDGDALTYSLEGTIDVRDLQVSNSSPV